MVSLRLPHPTNDFGLEAVLQYISQLDIDDIDDLQARNAQEDASLTDEELAKLIFAQEAESLLNVTRTHISGLAVPDSNVLIEELIAMEEMARFDHEVALAIAEDRPIPVRPEQPRNRPRSPTPLFEDDHDEYVHWTLFEVRV